MEDQATTTRHASQSDEGEEERIGLTFKGLSSTDSLDSNDANSLLSLTDHLRKKKDQWFILTFQVTDGRVVELIIDGSLKKFQSKYFPFENYQAFCQNYGPRVTSVGTQYLHESTAFFKLAKLMIYAEPHSFGSISSWMAEHTLPCATLFFDHFAQFESSFTLDPYLAWMTKKNLPDLKELVFRADELRDDYYYQYSVKDSWSIQMENIVTVLCNFDDHLAETISIIRICRDYKLSELHLETLLIQVLSRFPNLSLLQHTSCNEIPKFSEVLDRVVRHKRCTLVNLESSQLELDIWSPFFEGDYVKPEVPLAMLRFFKSFSNVCTFGSLVNYDACSTMDFIVSFQNRHKYPESVLELVYTLIKNTVGRRLIEGNKWGNGKGNNIRLNRKRNFDDHETRFSLPASVWPVVLERAYSNSHPLYHYKGSGLPAMKATGIYYLLREGPILRERHPLEEKERKKLRQQKPSVAP